MPYLHHIPSKHTNFPQISIHHHNGYNKSVKTNGLIVLYSYPGSHSTWRSRFTFGTIFTLETQKKKYSNCQLLLGRIMRWSRLRQSHFAFVTSKYTSYHINLRNLIKILKNKPNGTVHKQGIIQMYMCIPTAGPG